MLGTPYQTKLTFLANLLTILRILLQWKLDYDTLWSLYCWYCAGTFPTYNLGASNET